MSILGGRESLDWAHLPEFRLNERPYKVVVGVRILARTDRAALICFPSRICHDVFLVGLAVRFGFGPRVQGPRFRMVWLRVWGLGFLVWGLRVSRVLGLGFRMV